MAVVGKVTSGKFARALGSSTELRNLTSTRTKMNTTSILSRKRNTGMM